MTREEALQLTESAADQDMLLQPMRNRVLCCMVEADSQQGHIIIPEGARVTTGEAIVIDVGEGIYNYNEEKFVAIPDLQVGSRVQLAKYMGTQIELTEEERIPQADGNPDIISRKKRTYVIVEPERILAKYVDPPMTVLTEDDGICDPVSEPEEPVATE